MLTPRWRQDRAGGLSPTISSAFKIGGWQAGGGWIAFGLVAVLSLFSIPSVWARQGAPPSSAQYATLPLSGVAVVELPGVNARALRAADAQLAKPTPMRFAMPREVDIVPARSGTWETLSNQGRLWRLQVYVPGALHLNFGFTTYRLPPGATLHILSVSDNSYEGPYTARDNKAHGQLWTPLIAGDRVVIELYLPPGAAEPQLELTRVGAGYRDLLRKAPQGPGKQGSCNIDVVCAEGDPWRDQIRSVALYIISGAFSCTGQLVMDVPGTFRPFFLTAHHCGVAPGTAPSMVFVWNFESPTCGVLDGGARSDTQTGATFLASEEGVDVALVELDSQPEPAFQVFYTGWDRSATMPTGSVAIHHPQGDEKAISFNDDPLTIGDSCILASPIGNTHWFVDNWAMGTTEPGSSGSGLWDPESQKLIGTLSGGFAACGRLEFDCYGMFAVAWDRGVSASERLQDWLDPDHEGPLTVEGADPNLMPRWPLEIPDNDVAGVSDEQEIEQNLSITDVDVRVQIDHTRVGDLRIVLGSPSGTEVVLLDRAGVPQTALGCEDDHLDVIFDDGAETDLEGHCEATTPWYEAAALPLEPLDTLIGEAARGTWTLTVTDHAEMETGQLVDWALEIEGESVTPRLPLDIPDGDAAGVSHTQEVTENVTIADVEVRVQIGHTRVGDLEIVLQSPSGVEVVLLDRPGVPQTALGCEDDNLNVTFDDETKSVLEQRCDGTTPWFQGVAAPVEALKTFAGESAQGLWTLTVRDRASMELGQLIDWELNITPPINASVP